MKKLWSIISRVLVGLGFLLGYVIYIVCKWSIETFGVGIDEILFTITSPLEGSDTEIVKNALAYCLPGVVVVIALYVFLVFIDLYFLSNVVRENVGKKHGKRVNLTAIYRGSVALLSVISIVLGVMYVDKQYGLFEYISDRSEWTTLYEDSYVAPNDANIKLGTSDGKYKNLIYVYVESMETTYTSAENGGEQDLCYIPNLVGLANENITFSDGDKLGGFHNTIGTTYTMGALLSTTSGVPFSFPIGLNSMNTRETFASGLTTLGDILEGFGYNQEFLCGSDATFGGRRNYFTQHGNYRIFDYYTAKEKGYIPQDYFVFWGYEDMYLFEIAKDEVTKLASKDEPFNFTMLTVDTHHVSGYVCSLCESKYRLQTKNVVNCTDRQVANFVRWCQEQDFYENTAIIVTGDHPRMDNDMVGGVQYYDRTVYNCFINCETGDVEKLNTTNRIFTPMDMFPTTLAAMGFKWDGNRLGLGTNMFSHQKTLPEEMGFEVFDAELAKRSAYYARFY